MHILLKLCMCVEPKQHVVCNGNNADQMVFQSGCKHTELSLSDTAAYKCSVQIITCTSFT